MKTVSRFNGLTVVATALAMAVAWGCSDDDKGNNNDAGVDLGVDGRGSGGRGGTSAGAGSGGRGDTGGTAASTGGRGGQTAAVGGAGGQAAQGGNAGAVVTGGRGGAAGSSTGGTAGTGAMGGAGGAGTGGVAGAAGAAGGNAGAAAAAGVGGMAGMGGTAGTGVGGAGGSPTATLTDRQNLGVMLDANAGEVHTAEVAAVRSSNANVLTFATELMTDHNAANNRLRTIAQNMQVVAEDSPQRRMVSMTAADTVDMLWSVTLPMFDAAFLNAQIDLHTSVLNLLDTMLIPNTTNAQLKGELQMERTAVMTHLMHARTLLAAL